MTDLASEPLQLLRQARQWFSRHPDRTDAACVQANPRDVLQWMEDVDAVLLDQGQAPEAGTQARVGA